MGFLKRLKLTDGSPVWVYPSAVESIRPAQMQVDEGSVSVVATQGDDFYVLGRVDDIARILEEEVPRGEDDGEFVP